jgi:circadian clock protein KaiC
MARSDPPGSPLLSTGVAGLDQVLHGGLEPERLCLLEGTPGSGKTTLALQFLLAGVALGEPALLVTLSESEQELQAIAASHGLDLAGLHILDIVPSDEMLAADARYSMFHPSEVELSEVLRPVFGEAERLRPRRVVFDSLSELRLLAETALRYRRQILGLKRFFGRIGATTLLVDDRTSEESDAHLHSIAHGVITLQAHAPDYGSLRRRLQVTKMRARTFAEGYHDFVIRRGGLQVFPRLVAADGLRERPSSVLSSGLPGLDGLLDGGLLRGTSTLVLGAAGTGKSSVAAQFAVSAVRRGEGAALFLFDESLATFVERSAGLGMDVEPLVRAGGLRVRQVDPADLSPGEFAHLVRESVDAGGRVVVIDSLNGYLNAMPTERSLVLQLHELLTYLGQREVTTLLVLTHHGIVGDTQVPVDASYLADTVMLLRYFEARGEVRKAISVIKKRTGRHELTIRELTFDDGIRVGEPVRDFEGVLTGNPRFVPTSAEGAQA